MPFSPVIASKHITDKYKRYLRTIFRIADAHYARQFEEALANEGSFAAGPFLDVTDSFVKGMSIAELIENGVLSEGFLRLNMPLTRPLYKHQEVAVAKAILGHNLVVSTGTGSGKTESFLIPVFNHLLHESNAGQLSPGVRALFIYPMNALANDQMGRLRGLLERCPEITFGSYTGQTKQSFKDALAEYQALNEGQLPLKNELISREQILNTPPHILITNYAMLEYLMVRPKDSVFFDSDHADKWKYIVLDEAHVYHGSTGIEVSMLLRRLKASLQKKDIQYILTSATLGGESEDGEVAEFATTLCSSPFSKENIIRAQRIVPSPDRRLEPVNRSSYRDISDLIAAGASDTEILTYISTRVSPSLKGEGLSQRLHDMVLHDQSYWDVRFHLQAPKTVAALARALGWQQQDVADFVAVASKCENNGERIFDGRYHMFLRATESVFITLKPNARLFLNRKEFHYEGSEQYKVFEIAVCSSCHVIYLVGKEENSYLEQHSQSTSIEHKSAYLLADTISDMDEDYTLDDGCIRFDEYYVCAKCGHLRKASQVNGRYCEHGETNYIRTYKVRVESSSGTVTKCLACENVNSFGILRMFFTGQEAVTSVVGTALFEELPAHKVVQETVVSEDDDTGFGSGRAVTQVTKERIAKQFIAFSDSRQAAAFYASYLDLTYKSILYKRIITKALEASSPRKKTVDDFVDAVNYQFERHGVAVETRGLANKEAWKALLAEIVDNNGNTSLYRMGLLGLSICDDQITPNTTQNLSKEEVTSICSVFALGLMSDAALSYEANLTEADREFFTHNGAEYSYTLTDSDSKLRRKAFVPGKKLNKRLDYIIRVFERKGRPIARERAVEFLSAIWKHIFIAKNIVVQNSGSYRLNTTQIIVSTKDNWYQCDKCRKVTIHNIAGVCPTFKCEGTLMPVDCDVIFADNHYYELYKTMDIREMRVVEHTAQLDKDTAYEYQRQFQRKQVDILSCSTTFEMGVDVGTLETVFMRNMPPSPANYAQRAGRAGRSKHSAAFAITFCNKSSHDFTFFRHPERMIRGNIRPPKFKVENEKIAIRHVYASALGQFWSANPQYFANAAKMTEPDAKGVTGCEELKKYLGQKPASLMNYLLDFLPPYLSHKFAVETFGWVDGLIGNDGTLTKAVVEYDYEVNILEDGIKKAIEKRQRVDGMNSRLRVYKNEDILAFLSRKNVLPKYGFPVDVVEMSIFDRRGSSKLGLQLQRDLSIAISEYAPGSEIVANGNLITSRYIRKVPNMGWKMYDYIQCSGCNTLNIAPHIEKPEEPTIPACKQCGNSFEGAVTRTFLIPSFGFEADGESIRKPGLKKPERTYRGETAYVGYRADISLSTYHIGHGKVELALSSADEMATLNESRFYVCDRCGFTDLDEECYVKIKKHRHSRSSGHMCSNDILRNYSLGYRFETDVIQLRLATLDLREWDRALSVLYAVLRGACSFLGIEESDIAGCLQYYYDEALSRGSFALILFDKTPGGAGHVRRLNNDSVLDGVLRTALTFVEQCDCGGDTADSSCYSCLRGYYNQKQHDKLKRYHVIESLRGLFL